MAVLKSELTWSFSRDRLFRDCRRAYYYNYYASWTGWEKTADDLCRKAYILKNIQNSDMWIGDITHQIIKWILSQAAGKTSITLEQAQIKTKDMLMRTWQQSRNKLWQQNIKYNLNLLEHYYGIELTKEELTRKLQKAADSIRNFYSCGVLDLFDNLPRENFLALDELDTFEFEGLKIFAVPDFAVRNNGFTLYDWKTGKPSDNDTLQLSLYALYAQAKWKAAGDEIKIVPVYLAGENIEIKPVNPLPEDKVTAYMRASINEMKAILIDRETNKTAIERCPKTQEAWRCKNCKFQEICT
jgi:hypothetical protein